MSSAKFNYDVIHGIPPECRTQAALLYDEAFGPKIALAIPDQKARIQLYEKFFNLKFAIAAVQDGKLLGMAGFSTPDGSLTGDIEYKDLLSELGVFKGNRAAMVLSLYERRAVTGELLMDGISVGAEYRGAGVGSRLLTELIRYAKQAQYSTVRLDVIDTNSSAKKLYERVGFKSTKTEEFEFLRGILGFGGSTTMMFQV